MHAVASHNAVTSHIKHQALALGWQDGFCIASLPQTSFNSSQLFHTAHLQSMPRFSVSSYPPTRSSGPRCPAPLVDSWTLQSGAGVLVRSVSKAKHGRMTASRKSVLVDLDLVPRALDVVLGGWLPVGLDVKGRHAHHGPLPYSPASSCAHLDTAIGIEVP